LRYLARGNWASRTKNLLAHNKLTSFLISKKKSKSLFLFPFCFQNFSKVI
jgi:hypothetical protein